MLKTNKMPEGSGICNSQLEKAIEGILVGLILHQSRIVLVICIYANKNILFFKLIFGD